MWTRLAKTQHVALQPHDMEAVLNTLPNKWQMWCRLCAKEDPEGNVHVLLKNEQPAARISESNVSGSWGEHSNDNGCLVDFVEKFFCVQITSDDTLPKILCTDCCSLVTSLVEFTERVNKVQEMFLTLRNNFEGTEIDTQIVRLRFGVLDEERGNLFQHKPQPEVHYLETTINNNKREEQDSDEVPILNPLELTSQMEPNINIKIKGENITTTLRAKDYKQDSSDDDKPSFDNHDDILFRNEASESSDEEHIHDANNTEFKKETRNLKEYSGKHHLRKRRKPIYHESDASDSNKNECSESEGEFLPCTDCPRKFKGLKGLRRHMARIHSKKLPLVDVTCPKCPLSFKSEYKLKKHFKTHMSGEEQQAVSCSYCDKQFGSKYTLQVHIKHVHKDERPYVCETCGAGRRTRCSLREHMLTHTGYAPFKCEVCGKQFKTKYQLKRHMDAHDPSKHICAICGLQLNSLRILRDHLLVHSDEMRHKCDYCGRAFKRTSNFKHHLISHTGIKPYCCKLCDRGFSCAVNCRLHIKKMHPQEASANEKMYTVNMPKLEALKAYSKTGNNLIPVPSGPVRKHKA